ncbi:aminotransferase class V-fold PLP-dependent enzyme [Paraburkholderia sp. HD33-4]|uniref:aminotransferase class V-fold PLP-dependent enzyme n=1 Tax=Paraburkholderia sp. HD33-4 TaxID=2883242 RepID=UPI001F1665B5|nr:aminotransferase class V-fold PLP-dependent enzyme [Paraburkholderia sp. HD33-4]
MTLQDAIRDPSGALNWERVRELYADQHPLLNLNNAAVSPPPMTVERAVLDALHFISQNPDVNMWSSLDKRLPDVKRHLASIADCEPEEIALNRNASESLSTAIFGIPLKAGDHVLMSEWDYPIAGMGWAQRRQRENIEVEQVHFDRFVDDDAIVRAYVSAIRPQTRVIYITHMLHWTGKVLPSERICAIAREKGVLTVVDAAQSFAQMPISFRDMGCDYFITSLHKWLGAPVGNGMLIVNKERIATTWPLLAPFDNDPGSIGKFDHWNLGTYNSALQAGIEPAINLHEAIGVKSIHERLQHLTRYWINLARDIAGFEIHTDIETDKLGAVSLFSVKGVDSQILEQTLRDRYKVNSKYRKVLNLEGIRISPHIYMRESELDIFVDSLRDAVVRIR